jgi:hypothetical protein
LLSSTGLLTRENLSLFLDVVKTAALVVRAGAAVVGAAAVVDHCAQGPQQVTNNYYYSQPAPAQPEQKPLPEKLEAKKDPYI